MIYIGPAFNVNNIYLIFKVSIGLSRHFGFRNLLIDSKSDYSNELKSSDLAIIYTNSLGGKLGLYDVLICIKVLFEFLLNTSFSKFRSKVDYHTLLLHSAWDMSRLTSKSTNKFHFLVLFFLNLLRSIKYGVLYENFIKKNNFKIAFVSHDVYQYKIFNFILHKIGVNVYLCTNFTLGKYGRFDRPWFLRLYSDFCEIENLVKSNLEDFWKNRESGKAIYADVARNYSSDRELNYKFKGSNVIFLHVFRDSPFLDIDDSRLFKDYYDWFECTLTLINKSNECWFIKPHPSSARWGSSDREFILDNINKYCPELILKNKIFLIDENVNNFQLIEHSKRIVTFGGTIFLESIAKGKRPIIISYLDDESTGLSLEGAYLKPSCRDDYRKYLLLYHDFTVQEKSKLRTAKIILLIREDLFNLSEPLKLSYIYRGDSVDSKNSIFNSSVASIDNNYMIVDKVINSIVLGKPVFRFLF